MPNMKKIIYILLSFSLLLTACGEHELTPQWEFPGPDPVIGPGSRPVDQMCWDLYRKYDLRVYWNLEGEQALITENGRILESDLSGWNGYATPSRPAAEESAVKFLTLMTSFYDLLPQQLAVSSLNKRHVLSLINPADIPDPKDELGFLNHMHDEKGRSCGWYCSYWDFDEKSTVYYGYLDTPRDQKGDRFDTNLYDWKWSICFEFFRGQGTDYKRFPLTEEFGKISKGYYCNGFEKRIEGSEPCCDDLWERIYIRPLGYEQGFVHFLGSLAFSDEVQDDWGSYCAWILMEPQAQRQALLDAYPLVRKKYAMVIEWYRQQGLDLENMARAWQWVKVG